MMLSALLLATLCAASPDTSKVVAAPRRVVVLQDSSKAEDVADHWLGADKFKHFGMSYGITVFAYAGARTFAERDASRTLALTAGVAAGVLKEINDRRHARPFSARDLLWDLAGVGAGYAMMHNTR